MLTGYKDDRMACKSLATSVIFGLSTGSEFNVLVHQSLMVWRGLAWFGMCLPSTPSLQKVQGALEADHCTTNKDSAADT